MKQQRGRQRRPTAALLESPDAAAAAAREAAGETAGALEHRWCSIHARGQENDKSGGNDLKSGLYVLDPTAVRDRGGGR